MKQEQLEKEFMATFDTYSDAIFRFCLVKVSNKELAEDMTQEVFTRYWQSLRNGKEMTNVRSFLYTIANNMAKDWYKRKKADSLDDRLDAGFDPRDEKATDQMQEAEYGEVLGVIDELEPRDREVVVLRFVEGLDPKDIAEILDETANAVSVRITRALNKLQTKLNV